MSEELDPAEFVQRIRQLGEQRDQQDAERVRKLEEEIIQGRSERLARRAGMFVAGARCRPVSCLLGTLLIVSCNRTRPLPLPGEAHDTATTSTALCRQHPPH